MIDDKIRNSGVLSHGSLDFNDAIKIATLDVNSCAEASDFIGKHSKIPHDSLVYILDDGSDSGVALSLSLALAEMERLYDCAQGHLYFVDQSADLFAIIKMALWVSVRV